MSVKNYKTVIPIFKFKVFRLNSTSFYIARRIAFGGRASFSSFIIKIAIAAVALSLAVMIISTAIIAGFKKEISDKIFGFWGHIRITNFQSNTSFENTSPIDKRQVFFPLPYFCRKKRVAHLAAFPHIFGFEPSSLKKLH